MTAFFSDNPTPHQVWLGHISADIIGILIVLFADLGNCRIMGKQPANQTVTGKRKVEGKKNG